MVETPATLSRGESSVRVASGARYFTLDAIRGVAALVVVSYHAALTMHIRTPGLGYLAVDLFFVLSGFVIAHNYDHRLATDMGFLDFAWRRFSRLLPMMAVGALCGLFTPVGVSLSNRLVSVLLNSFGLPGVPVHSGWPIMPLNTPLWSLFMEIYVANASYALISRFLTPLRLGLLVGVAALGMAWTAHTAGWFNVGWGWGRSNFPHGVIRVLFGFYAGVALARIHVRHPPPSIPPLVLIAAVGGLLFMALPHTHTARVELLITVVLFPALVYLASNKQERRPRLGAMLGEASYALYVIHWPILQVLSAPLLAAGWNGMPTAEKYAIHVVEVITLFAVAFALDKWPDQPAQAWLRGLRNSRRNLTAVSQP